MKKDKMITNVNEWKKFTQSSEFSKAFDKWKLNEDITQLPDDLSIGGGLNLTNAKITSLDGVPKWIGGALSKEQVLSMDYDRICMLHKHYNLDKYKIDTSLFSDEEMRKYNAEIETAKFIDLICKKGKKYLTDLQRSSGIEYRGW